jgi:hypothetical protein
MIAKTHVEIFFNFGVSKRKITETPCFFYKPHYPPFALRAGGDMIDL